MELTQTDEPTGAEFLQAVEDAERATRDAWGECLNTDIRSEEERLMTLKYYESVDTLKDAIVALQEYKDSK